MGTGQFSEHKLNVLFLRQVAEKLPGNIFTGISAAFVYAPVGISRVFELPFQDPGQS